MNRKDSKISKVFKGLLDGVLFIPNFLGKDKLYETGKGVIYNLSFLLGVVFFLIFIIFFIKIIQ